MKLDILYFGAHPDDVELSCGGTVIKLVKAGKKSGIIDLTEAELSTSGTVFSRKKETNTASRLLGIDIRENLKIKDGNIENNEWNRLLIIKKIRDYRPRIVFIPYPEDRHPDHIHTSILLKEAIFYSGLEKISTILNGTNQLSYRPDKIIYYMQTNIFNPSFIIDITDEYILKMKSIRAYKSQFFHPRKKGKKTFISEKKFIDYLEARAKFYGFQIGVKFGEPFYIDSIVKLSTDSLFI
jgi:N-acetylglucosamine malate deacetylase 1